MKKTVVIVLIAIIAFFCVSTLSAQKINGEAGIGFMAISPPLTDAIAAFDVKEMLYGVSVSYAVRPWLGVTTDVLYFGDLYYGPSTGAFSEGPLSWSSMTTKTGARADWPYYESFIYAPLSINLMAPLGIVRPYIGMGPAFYFHFPSTNQDAAFTAYLKSHYGSASVIGRIGQGITARVGFDVFLTDTISLGAGYVVREDTPATIFNDIGTVTFYKEKGYGFLVARVFIK